MIRIPSSCSTAKAVKIIATMEAKRLAQVYPAGNRGGQARAAVNSALLRLELVPLGIDWEALESTPQHNRLTAAVMALASRIIDEPQGAAQG